MVKAYILIEMVAGYSTSMVAALRRSHAVKSVDRVTGPYDVIAVIEAEDINDVSNVVSEEIHTLQGVTRTLTCIALA